MRISEVADGVYAVDTEIGGEKGIVFSYIVDRGDVAVVETGAEKTSGVFPEVFEELGIKPEKVKFIAVTHVHLDHGGAAGSLVRICEKAKVIVHPRGAEHLINPERLWRASKSVLNEIAEIYGKPLPIEDSRIVVSEDNSEFTLGNSKIKVVHTPGHAPHHQSFVLDKILFPGDSAGVYKDGHVIPTTPPVFNFEKAVESIRKMRRLNVERIAYTHFGIGEKEMLDRIEEKLFEWKDLALSCESVEGMHEKLLEVDEDYRFFWEWLKKSKFAESYFHLALRGFMEAVGR